MRGREDELAQRSGGRHAGLAVCSCSYESVSEYKVVELMKQMRASLVNLQRRACTPSFALRVARRRTATFLTAQRSSCSERGSWGTRKRPFSSSAFPAFPNSDDDDEDGDNNTTGMKV